MHAEDKDLRIELVAGTSNVVRFPVERRARPTLDLLREIADASVAASHAQQRVVDAQSEGGYWLFPLEERAEALTMTAVQLMVEAHIRSEEAEGAARAVGMAMRGEAWVPFDLQAETEALFFGPTVRRAG
jgi:hypothetical protein